MAGARGARWKRQGEGISSGTDGMYDNTKTAGYKMGHERFEIHQRIKLASGVSDWIKIDWYSKESKAWEALDRFKLTGADVSLVKVTETVLESPK